MNNYRKLDAKEYQQFENLADAVISIFNLDLSKDSVGSIYENGKLIIFDYYPAGVTGTLLAFDPLDNNNSRWYSVCQESKETTLSSDDPKRVSEIEKMCQKAVKKRGM